MYDYQKERPHLFTDDGQRLLLKVRDRIALLVKTAGACTIGRVLDAVAGDSFVALDSFQALACIDRLEELGEIRILRHGLASTQACVIVPAQEPPMRLFYVAAYGPKAHDPVWDHFLLAEDEAEAKAKADGSEEFQSGSHFPVGYSAGSCGYTVQKVREMKLPPSHHFANYPLLGSGMTVGEWWRSFNPIEEGVRDGE